MANFKRGRCRLHVHNAIRGSQTSWRAKNGFTPIRITNEYRRACSVDEWMALWRRQPKRRSHLCMMNSSPAWFDRLFHTRPARAKTRRLVADIRKGYRDPDNTCWPDYRKPRSYYW